MGAKLMTGNNSGFTLLEMLMVVAIIGVIALASVPIAEISFVRNQEELLQESLDQIRQAIEDYKRDCRNYVIRQTSSHEALWAHESLYYPPELKALFNPDPTGYEIKWKDRSGSDLSVTFKPPKYLDRMPADPFVGNSRWRVYFASGTSTVLYENGAHAIPIDHQGVFDVAVDSDPAVRKGFVTAIDGTEYEDW